MERSRPQRGFEWMRLKYWIPAIVACGIHCDFFQPLFHAGPNRQGNFAHSSLVPTARFLDTHPSSALRYSETRACHGIWRIQHYGISCSARATPGLAAQLGVADVSDCRFLAVIDEFHPSYVPRRHASAKDVAIDGLGAILAQLVVWWYAKGVWPSEPIGKSSLLARCDYGTIAETSFE
jgi:VanZ family protein